MTGRAPAARIRAAAVGGPGRARDLVARRDEHRGQRTPDRPARAGQEDACHGREDYVEPADDRETEPAQPRIDARDVPLDTICRCDPTVRSRSRSPASPSRRTSISRATWRRAQHSLPGYLLAHSVRSYCWGAGIAAERRLELRPADPVDRLAPPRRGADDDPSERVVLRGRGRTLGPPVPGAGRAAGR